MTTSGRLVPVALAALLGAGGARAQEARPVTLDEALRLALRNQPAMVQARQDVRVASAQERQAFGAFLPSVSTNMTGSRSGATRIEATTGRPIAVPGAYNSTLGLSASLELFTGFRRGAQRRATASTTELREATRLRQEYAVALAAKQAFFNALAATELVAVAETRLLRADEQLKLAVEKLRLGAATRSDSLRARVEYGNAQLQLVQARADLQTTQAVLGRTIGVEGVPIAPVPDSALESRLVNLDTAALRREALAAAPTVREAGASVAAASASLSATRAAYLPTVTATGNQSWAAADLPFQGTPFTSSWNVRVALSYPIFNGFQREATVVTADAGLAGAEARLRDARLLLEANLTQAFAALAAAAARIDIARVSLAAAEEDLRMQRERYRLGSSTIFEVLSSQVSVDQAQVDLVRARYDYLVARAQIEAYVGRAL
ncbi:MAG: TolC family protein [Gemmatimonadetes bacterium]|nr:TolC family protein [Gemmatimonadota bacterium]